MSLPNQLQDTFSPKELQFMVENEPIKIFPRFTTRQRIRKQRNDLLGTDSHRWKMMTMDDTSLNNMMAMQSTTVTLWIALLLKQQSKCNIIAPEWLTSKALDRALQFEQTNTLRFSPLPWDWLIISEILFKKAPDDFHDRVHELRSKIQDLREIRQLKVAKGIRYMNESHLQLDNLSLLEINELRPFISGIMDKLRDIHLAAVDAGGEDEMMGEEDDNDEMFNGTMRNESSRMS
ncbi:DNA replication complex GINS protein Psf2p [Monosporozyma unispora]|nr:DNA replication protein psf2 [Kazachstania unispora]